MILNKNWIAKQTIINLKRRLQFQTTNKDSPWTQKKIFFISKTFVCSKKKTSVVCCFLLLFIIATLNRRKQGFQPLNWNRLKNSDTVKHSDFKSVDNYHLLFSVFFLSISVANGDYEMNNKNCLKKNRSNDYFNIATTNIKKIDDLNLNN